MPPDFHFLAGEHLFNANNHSMVHCDTRGTSLAAGFAWIGARRPGGLCTCRVSWNHTPQWPFEQTAEWHLPGSAKAKGTKSAKLLIIALTTKKTNDTNAGVRGVDRTFGGGGRAVNKWPLAIRQVLKDCEPVIDGTLRLAKLDCQCALQRFRSCGSVTSCPNCHLKACQQFASGGRGLARCGVHGAWIGRRRVGRDADGIVW